MGILSFPKNFHIANIVDKVKSLSATSQMQSTNTIQPPTQPSSSSNNIVPPMDNINDMSMHDINPSAPPIIEEEFQNHNAAHPQPNHVHQPYYPSNAQPYVYPYPTTYQFSPIQSTNTNTNPHPVTHSQVLPYPVEYSAAVDRNNIDMEKKRQMEYDELLATSLQFGDEPVRCSICSMKFSSFYSLLTSPYYRHIRTLLITMLTPHNNKNWNFLSSIHSTNKRVPKIPTIRITMYIILIIIIINILARIQQTITT
jgi:hypothetical protein